MKDYLIPALLICWLFTGALYSQNITINKLPLLDRLPVNAIHRIYQDSEGYMWYGTIDGLCRDDGYDLKIFRSDLDRPELLASNHITAIVEDKDHKIWFGTLKGVYILDKADYSIRRLEAPGLCDKQIIEMAVSSNGDIWICIVGTLFRYSPDGTLLKEYALDMSGGGRTIHNLLEDNKGQVLISIWRDGIYKLDEENDQLELYTSGDPQRSEKTYFIQDKKTDCLWIGTWGRGIVRFDPKAHPDSMYIPQPLPVNNKNETDGVVLYMQQDDIYGYLWVTSLTDLFVFEITDSGMLRQMNTSPFLPQSNKMLNEIIKDRDGNLWISAYDQASFIINFNDNKIKEYPIGVLYDRINGNPAIVSISKDESGTYWMSQERIGLCIYSAEKELIRYYSDCPAASSLPLNNISQICRSRHPGNMWVAPYSTSIYLMKQDEMKMQVLDHIDLNRLSPRSGIVESLCEGSNYDLWIGTTAGLFHYQQDNKILKLISDTLGIISGIVETSDGAIWFASQSKGIFRMEENYGYTNYPVPGEILCMDATPDGKLWLGTEQGNVLFFDPEKKRIKDYSCSSGMNGDKINKILVDAYNHIWIFTNRKLTEYNPQNEAFRNYLVSDHSFLLDRFLPRSAYKDIDGTLYFGGIPGFVSFKPTHHLESIPKQVETVITDVATSDGSLWLDNKNEEISRTNIEIKPNDHNLSVYFSSLDHRNARKIRYAYRLIGVDKDWVYLGDGKNYAFYNHLNKGKYLFEVKATDEKGLWSNQVTRLAINRLPAFYETWWAYSFYCLLIIALLYSLIFVYQRRLKKSHETKLAEQVSLMKLNYFTNNSHDRVNNLFRRREELRHEYPKSRQIEVSNLKFTSQDEGLIKKAILVVEAHLSNPDFDVEILARELNVSRSTLSRKIKVVCGLTPLEFIRNIKMKQACRILQNKSMTIAEVAYMTGYQDRKYFASCFKDEFGVTPSEYQKNL